MAKILPVDEQCCRRFRRQETAAAGPRSQAAIIAQPQRAIDQDASTLWFCEGLRSVKFWQGRIRRRLTTTACCTVFSSNWLETAVIHLNDSIVDRVMFRMPDNALLATLHWSPF
jgi:hypothetical protein